MSSPTVPRGAEAKFKLGPDTGVSSRGWGPPQGAPRAPGRTEDSPEHINPPRSGESAPGLLPATAELASNGLPRDEDGITLFEPLYTESASP